MSSSQTFCENCGKPLCPGARFCQICGRPVVRGRTPEAAISQPPRAVVPPAPRRAASSIKFPLPAVLLGAGVLIVAALVVALILGQEGGIAGSNAALNSVVVTSTPPASLTSAATPSESVSQIPTATALAPRPSVAPSPSTAPLPVQATTATPTAALSYDLYVKRMNYAPGGSDLVAGQKVRFNILIATDIYPDSGPLFPTTRVRWRPGVNYDWVEALCPADTHYAKCDSSFEFTYPQSGAYDFEVEVDYRGEVAETNESNNSGRVTLQVGSARPTVAPTAVPKLKPVYSDVTFSNAFDEDNQVPVNPGKVFDYGVTIIYSYWTYSGAVPGTRFDFDWYRDGARVDGSGETFVNTSGKAFQWHNYGYTPKDPLIPGNYQFMVRVNGQVIVSGGFVIQQPQIGGPIPGAFTVFFTIQNGAPTGWVYDKEGAKHSPAYGTIGDLRVSPGDRIVLQTDAQRFSLLFDCSTTPGTFDPCDFSADSRANLPRELRAIKRGMSGFLNISRADNWAGFRSGFEPQRYPADPVLRIMFSW